MIHEGREGIESRDKEFILQCKESRVKTIYMESSLYLKSCIRFRRQCNIPGHLHRNRIRQVTRHSFLL